MKNIIVVMLLALLSCSTDNWLGNDLYDPSGKKRIDYYVDSSGWEVVVENEKPSESYTQLKKMDGDTIKSLALVKYNHDKKVRVDTYSKIFKTGGTINEMVFRGELFYYLKDSAGVKEFLHGEYNYRAINGLFKTSELDYYLLYQDSLASLVGDSLPMLPELTNREKYRLNELLNR